MKQIRDAEQKFLALLGSDERKRYRLEAKPWLKTESNRKNGEVSGVDVTASKRWVAKKAYDFGWSKQLFQHEPGAQYEYKNDRALVERIGKKYQWLALSELLCRFSDNYWIGGTHGNGTRKYDNPTDIDILRDIDPTIVPRVNGGIKAQDKSNAWMLGPEISMPSTPEDDLTTWPFSADLGKMFPRLISRDDPDNVEWITLYDHRNVTTRYERDTAMIHGIRQQEFRFVFCIVVSRENKGRLIDYLKGTCKIDVTRWNPPELTDGPYLREAPWRATWPQIQWQSDGWRAPKDLPIAFPVCDYLWESILDASLPEGARAFLPAPWLAVDLKLLPDQTDASIYRDAAGKSQFIGSKRGGDGSSALIDAEMFNSYLDRGGLTCIWLFVTERGSWPGGHNENAGWRRTEGICWIEDGKPTIITWNEDRVNGR